MIALRVVLVLFTLWFAMMQFGSAEAKNSGVKHEQHYVSIPVYFITDRNRLPCKDKAEHAKFGNLRQYLGKCNHDPHVGVAHCVIENTKRKPITGDLEQLGWHSAEKHHEGTLQVNLINGCTYEQAKDQFYDQIYNKTAKTPDQDVIVFAPGYMSTFESGVREAARFGYYSERPVVLFSWPSKGKFKDYTSDEASIEWSQDHYNDMIDEFAELGKRTPAPHVRLFAHSMGSRLVVRAVPLITGRPIFKEMSVICPDIDDGLVKHYVRKYVSGENQATVRLYMSHKDRMLRLSQLVHGGYARLGEREDVLPDVSPYKQEEGYKDPVITAGAHKRFQTIDFSSMDTGTLGHKIPVALICSLSRQGTPPDDVQLTQKLPSQQDCSQTMIRLSDLTDYGDNLPGGYFQADFINGKTPIVGAVWTKLPRFKTLFGKDWTIK